MQAGGFFPRKIEFQYDGEEVVYIGCENPEDGEGYEDSIKEMFSEEAFKEYKKYNAYDESGNPLLMEKQKEKIEYIWKVDISEEDMLNINEDGSYEIVWTTGGGPEEPFEVHTKETGVLSRGENCNHQTTHVLEDFK